MSTLISLSGVAELVGGSLSAVTNWRARFDDFPDPLGPGEAARRGAVVKGRPVAHYDRTEVVEWLVAHGKLDPSELGADRDEAGSLVQRAASAIDAPGSSSSGAAQAGDLAAFALAIVARTLLDVLVESDRVDPAAARAVDRRHDGPLSGWRSSLPAAEHREIRAALGERLTRSDVAAVADGLRAEFAAFVGRTGLYDSPSVQQLLVGLVEDLDAVHDPCCSSGQLLALAARRNISIRKTPAGEVTLRGQEIDPALAAAADALLTAEGFGAEVIAADTLTLGGDRTTPDLSGATSVIASPPLNHRLRAGDTDDSDPRWVYRPGSSGTSAWVQHCLSVIEGTDDPDRSRAAVLVSTTWLGAGRPSSGDTRKNNLRATLVRRRNVEAVVLLPTGLAAGPRSAAALLVLRPDRSAQGPEGETVLFIDLSGKATTPTPTGPELADAVGEKVVSQLSAVRAGVAPDAELPVALVHVDEVLANGAVLLPGRYLSADAEPNRSDSSVRKLPQLVEALGKVASELGERPDDDSSGPSSKWTAALGDHLQDHSDGGAIELRSGSELFDILGPDAMLDEGSSIVLLRLSGTRFGEVELVADPSSITPETRTMVGFVVRDTQVDPGYLAALLASASVQAQLDRESRSGSASQRSASARIVVRLPAPAALPSIDEQRQVGDRWRALAQAEHLLTETHRRLAIDRGGLVGGG